MFGLPAGSELILLILIILLLFGSARLPRLARSLREAKAEFQKEKDGPSGEPGLEGSAESPTPEK